MVAEGRSKGSLFEERMEKPPRILRVSTTKDM